MLLLDFLWDSELLQEGWVHSSLKRVLRGQEHSTDLLCIHFKGDM